LAFIGLGLAFWGSILLYVQNQDYVPAKILDASLPPLTEALDETIEMLGYMGDPVYLPPKYFENPEDTKIFIPKQKTSAYPTPEETAQSEHQAATPRGLLLTPPGFSLCRLFEKTLETSFTRVDLQYIEKYFPKLLVEDLEIAKNVEINSGIIARPENEALELTGASSNKPETNRFQIKITTSPYENTFYKGFQKPTGIGSPLISAIACAIAKATGRPTSIDKQEITPNGETITVEYTFKEETERRPE
jgi:hypothetical protein